MITRLFLFSTASKLQTGFWILATGFWDNDGVWDNDAAWIN